MVRHRGGHVISEPISGTLLSDIGNDFANSVTTAADVHDPPSPTQSLAHVVRTSVGRSVDAVLVSAHQKPDVMATVFLLEPLGGNGSAEAGRWGADNLSAPHPPLDPHTPARP